MELFYGKVHCFWMHPEFEQNQQHGELLRPQSPVPSPQKGMMSMHDISCDWRMHASWGQIFFTKFLCAFCALGESDWYGYN